MLCFYRCRGCLFFLCFQANFLEIGTKDFEKIANVFRKSLISVDFQTLLRIVHGISTTCTSKLKGYLGNETKRLLRAVAVAGYFPLPYPATNAHPFAGSLRDRAPVLSMSYSSRVDLGEIWTLKSGISLSSLPHPLVQPGSARKVLRTRRSDPPRLHPRGGLGSSQVGNSPASTADPFTQRAPHNHHYGPGQSRRSANYQLNFKMPPARALRLQDDARRGARGGRVDALYPLPPRRCTIGLPLPPDRVKS